MDLRRALRALVTTALVAVATVALVGGLSGLLAHRQGATLSDLVLPTQEALGRMEATSERLTGLVARTLQLSSTEAVIAMTPVILQTCDALDAAGHALVACGGSIDREQLMIMRQRSDDATSAALRRLHATAQVAQARSALLDITRRQGDAVAAIEAAFARRRDAAFVNHGEAQRLNALAQRRTVSLLAIRDHLSQIEVQANEARLAQRKARLAGIRGRITDRLDVVRATLTEAERANLGIDLLLADLQQRIDGPGGLLAARQATLVSESASRAECEKAEAAAAVSLSERISIGKSALAEELDRLGQAVAQAERATQVSMATLGQTATMVAITSGIDRAANALANTADAASLMDAGALAKLTAHVQTNADQLDAGLTTLAGHLATLPDAATDTAIVARATSLAPAARKALLGADGLLAARHRVIDARLQADTAAIAMLESADRLSRDNRARSASAQSARDAAVQRLRLISVAAPLLLFLVALSAGVAALWRGRSITTGIMAAEDDSRRRASALATLVEQMTPQAQRVGAAARELELIATTLTGAANGTLARAELTATTARRVDAGLDGVTSGAQRLAGDIDGVASRVALASDTGQEAVALAQEAGGMVTALGETGDSIGRIVTLIDHIAQQTMILSLNATIEASKAGLAGRGFAVVATEVRDLADKIRRSNSEVAAQVAGVRERVNAAVDAINRIQRTVGRVEELQREVTQATLAGAATTADISRAMSDAGRDMGSILTEAEAVAIAAREASATAQRTDLAAKDLGRLAEVLLALTRSGRQ